ncbi:MAG: spore coat protein U domain-containing protein [Pseudomonadota bacterium]
MKFKLMLPILGLLLAPAAQATFHISNCTLTPPAAMIFNTNLSNGLTSTTSFSVSCTTSGGGSGVYTITLSSGSGTEAQRKLISGSNVLNYNLYQDAAFTQPWGATSGTWNAQTATGDFSNKSFTIYGKIASGAPNNSAPPGVYTDPSIIVTITW